MQEKLKKDIIYLLSDFGENHKKYIHELIQQINIVPQLRLLRLHISLLHSIIMYNKSAKKYHDTVRYPNKPPIAEYEHLIEDSLKAPFTITDRIKKALEDAYRSYSMYKYLYSLKPKEIPTALIDPSKPLIVYQLVSEYDEFLNTKDTHISYCTLSINNIDIIKDKKVLIMCNYFRNDVEIKHASLERLVSMLNKDIAKNVTILINTEFLYSITYPVIELSKYMNKFKKVVYCGMNHLQNVHTLKTGFYTLYTGNHYYYKHHIQKYTEETSNNIRLKWWFKYFIETPECAHNRLMQIQNTCWYNSILNAIMLSERSLRVFRKKIDEIYTDKNFLVNLIKGFNYSQNICPLNVKDYTYALIYYLKVYGGKLRDDRNVVTPGARKLLVDNTPGQDVQEPLGDVLEQSERLFERLLKPFEYEFVCLKDLGNSVKESSTISPLFVIIEECSLEFNGSIPLDLTYKQKKYLLAFGIFSSQGHSFCGIRCKEGDFLYDSKNILVRSQWWNLDLHPYYDRYEELTQTTSDEYVLRFCCYVADVTPENITQQSKKQYSAKPLPLIPLKLQNSKPQNVSKRLQNSKPQNVLKRIQNSKPQNVSKRLQSEVKDIEIYHETYTLDILLLNILLQIKNINIFISTKISNMHIEPKILENVEYIYAVIYMLMNNDIYKEKLPQLKRLTTFTTIPEILNNLLNKLEISSQVSNYDDYSKLTNEQYIHILNVSTVNNILPDLVINNTIYDLNLLLVYTKSTNKLRYIGFIHDSKYVVYNCETKSFISDKWYQNPSRFVGSKCTIYVNMWPLISR